jgi:predicted glycogen debranching enzyme
MQVSKQNEFVANPDWYRGVEYFKEERRGYHYKEDLYVPGYFEVEIKKGESIIFSASVKEQKTSGFKTKFNKELTKRIPRDSFYNNLLNAAQQFFVTKDKEITMLAGYHWYGKRLRDTLIASPLLTKSLGANDVFVKILSSSYELIHSRITDPDTKNMIEVDTPLWFFWTIQQCWGDLCKYDLWKEYKSFLKLIIQSYINNRFDNVRILKNGLIHSFDNEVPLTWMNGISDGKPVTPRNGTCVEVNALWYNALMFYLEMASGEKKKDEFVDVVANLAEKVKESFNEIFWNEEGRYLYDLVNGDFKDISVRPNQIFTTAFEYSPLNNEQKKSIIDISRVELVTPKGLRSLSPQDSKYKGVITGAANKREKALHQGTVWSWLISFYAEGYLKLHKRSGVNHIKAIAENFEDEMNYHCIGTLSEYYDGNPPHVGKGAVSMAWNVAGVLKLLNLIEKYS